MKLGETAKNLAVLVLLTLHSTGVASAAPPSDLGVITCNALTVPPIVRAEGIAELVGDIILVCINTPPPIGRNSRQSLGHQRQRVVERERHQ